MDVEILCRVECVDEVALQAMLQQHPGGAAREVQAGGRCKVGRVVYRLFGVEWRGRQKSSKPGKLRIRNSEQGLMPWKRRKEYSAECRCKLDEQRKKMQIVQGNAGEPQGVSAAPVARCGEKEE